MRLEREEVSAIKRCVRKTFGDDAVVRLFGSRVDDTRRGGDIDLHVVTEDPATATHRRETEFLTDLEELIGERKVDVVTTAQGKEPSLIDRRAFEHGIVL